MYKEHRGEFMGYFSSATLVGRLIAPLMAGSLITIYSFREAYIACGVFGTAALITLIKFPETKSSYHTSKEVSMRVLKVLSNPGILVASTVMALTYFAMQSIETFLPLYMETIKDVGQASGPIVMGLLTTYITYGEAFMVIAIITAATIALNIALHIKMRPQT
ncbi:MAG: hypothetical protein B6U85_03280 [Desulfurococcales archaeon ex4484_42]|nr:MAG: hypothetical protein B6U85_03280 [Desulfurococcales archaeon ex4484_42]